MPASLGSGALTTLKKNNDSNTKSNSSKDEVKSAKKAKKHQLKHESRTKNKTTKRQSESGIIKASDPDKQYDSVQATRVCIKNLPKKWKEEDLRAFLLEQLPKSNLLKQSRDQLETRPSCVKITDCKILRDPKTGKSRRVAFCGFSTSQQAAACKERLHQSYCGQTSRLLVDYAKRPTTYAESKGSSADEKGHPVDINPDKGHAKGESNTGIEKNQRLEKKKQEFLSVMGLSSSTAATSTKASGAKFWANDDDAGQAVESLGKKEQKSEASDDPDVGGSSDVDSLDQENEESKPVGRLESSSDMDFLRSKQVAVSDLMDGEEKDDESNNDCSHNVEQDDEGELAELACRNVTGHGSDVEKKVDDNVESDGDNDAPTSQAAQNRVFLRNLAFTVTEEDLQQLLHNDFGAQVTECHVCVDDRNQSKGYAFVTFAKQEDCQRALQELDGTDFQGRLLHVIPARAQQSVATTPTGHTTGNSSSYKKQMEQERREAEINLKAGSGKAGWMSSFVRGDAVADSLASRLGLTKGSIMAVKDGLSGGDAAVRLALAETAIIEENRSYFLNHGIDMDALVSWNKTGQDNKTAGYKESADTSNIKRSKTAILVKNLPHSTTFEDLTKVFGTVVDNAPQRILLPPSRTIAVVEYSSSNDARKVFRKLAYRRFKTVPLYLEWAPLAATASSKNASDENSSREKTKNTEPQDVDSKANEALATKQITGVGEDDEEEVGADNANATLYVKNLNFTTTEDGVRAFFEQHGHSVRFVRIPKKVAPRKKRPRDSVSETTGDDLVQSMGYGFVEFDSSEASRKAMKAMQGKIIDGHAMELKPSKQSASGRVPTKRMDAMKSNRSSKLMVRNVPFQANRSELLKLFGTFGQLKRVRLPKKFDGTHRGFAFIEYLTHHEAEKAMTALSRTHLYGRHLVLEWAAEDDLDQVNEVSTSKRSRRTV